MSSGGHSRQASSRSSASARSHNARPVPPPISLTPENEDPRFEPCAATASFLLYAQRNVILVLHHDTLAIERRFDFHREEVIWIAVDNTSERGSGRLAVSYDDGNTAIVWDILTGGEVARFSAYERMKVASFMRNGNIAFGNDQGNIILFEPSTSEHISARTIFDPITAIAPSADCRTFAIGYLNGSILIATLQPSFTILHTLTTQRSPSRIMGLAWHGSSSKQKTDMLATQTLDGDLRVWSVPKASNQEAPNIIRVLQRSDNQAPGPCWFAWSKNGRIVQHAEGETRSWDVRTKRVTYEIIPTVDDVMGITVYGPSATLFTLGRGHTVQQYDINPSSQPMQVASVQHAPANTPPTPPTFLDERKNPYMDDRSSTVSGPSRLPLYAEIESSADESSTLSPLQKIAQEMDSLDALESEIRDKVMPLSPSSSRASSVSSRSSGRGAARNRKYLYDRPSSSRASSTSGADGTEFSFGGPGSIKQGRDSMSIRSTSSYASRPRHRSGLRKEILRSPDESKAMQHLDLFPFTKARLRDVAFRTPHYGNGARTPELLQREMLGVIFGWNDTARMLIRDELMRHRPGSASAVLLSKWVGGMGADDMAAMIGSETMTSADWMLLALSSIGSESQKKVGEAFVQRLLEKGDIHPAVAILLGLGEPNEAIEIYVSQGYWMEAVLLTCLQCPSDWQRQSFLVRKWGERAVQGGQAELAVRCFSCTSVETTEPWFSPRAQDAAYTAQQERLTGPLYAGPNSPPLSPPSQSASSRLTQKNASLRLITNFGTPGNLASLTADMTPMVVGATPIAESALSPIGDRPWRRERSTRDVSEARTATPGGYTRRKRLPSKSDIERAKQEAAELTTPITAARDYGSKPSSQASHSRRTSNASVPEPLTTLRAASYDPNDNHLPSPAQGVFTRLGDQLRPHDSLHDRKPDGLSVKIVQAQYAAGPNSVSIDSALSSAMPNRLETLSPLLTAQSSKSRAIDDYISSVEEARNVSRQERTESRRRGESRKRTESRGTRASSRGRMAASNDIEYTAKARHSPTSPVPMSPAEVVQATGGLLTAIEPTMQDEESFYKRRSANESEGSRKSGRDRARSRSRAGSVAGRSGQTLEAVSMADVDQDQTSNDDAARSRARSSSRKPGEARRGASQNRRERSSSRRPKPADSTISESRPRAASVAETLASDVYQARPRLQGLTRKELAAKELEERRMSLARRPSAPSIPLPGELLRPQMSPRSHTDNGSILPGPLSPPTRSHTVDPEAMSKYNRSGGQTLPQIGLPATPRAMRHPRYMSTDPNEREGIPPVPDLPSNPSELSSMVSSVTGSNLSYATGTTQSVLSSTMYQAYPQSSELDDLGPLLPSTVFGQKGPQAPMRAASAPPEKQMGLAGLAAYKAAQPASQARLSGHRGQIRKIAPPEGPLSAGVNHTSIDDALRQSEQVIVIGEESQPILLPELQHLAGPPPPPPPPTMFQQGVINIAIGDNPSAAGVIDVPVQSLPQPTQRSMTTSPTTHRRAQSSASEAFGSRIRGVTERIRSSSRSRTRADASRELRQTSPYETSLPPMPIHYGRDAVVRAKSPYEQAMDAGQLDGISSQIPPPPPPPSMPSSGLDGRIQETTIPPTTYRPPSRSQSAMGGYRHPREIRANMPPGALQHGVEAGQGGFL